MTDVGRRLRALGEVLLCSGVPTQTILQVALTLAGWPPIDAAGRLLLPGVTLLALADTVLLVALVAVLLRAGGERPARVIFGAARTGRDVLAGLALIPVVLGLASLAMGTLRIIAPWMHNVPETPFAGFLTTPGRVVAFVLVVVVAGGVREEIQRAFLLHRFEQHLGGRWWGLFAVSAAFGLGHLKQGYDAALVLALLGATWGFVFLRRRSAVAPMVSHAGFNLLEVAQFVMVGRPGV